MDDLPDDIEEKLREFEIKIIEYEDDLNISNEDVVTLNLEKNKL